MIRNAFWATLIVGALAAIVAGFFQASATTHPPPVAQLRSAQQAERQPAPVARTAEGGGAPDRATNDGFASDDVVVERVRAVQSQWQPERLALIVGLCGKSVAAESGFLRLGFPAAFVVDPQAPQAAAFSKYVRDAGQALFVQVPGPPDAASLDRLRRALGPFDGVASRDAAGMAAALRGSQLAFFDELGNSANAASFAALGVQLYQRDVTADDRSGPGYVSFMLARAAGLSRRVGPVIVFVRPLPSTLAVLRAFPNGRDVQMVALR